MLDTDSWPDNGIRCGFYFVEQDLSPIKKCLASPMMFISLLHYQACLARRTIILLCKV